jgi:hypothetical protein
MPMTPAAAKKYKPRRPDVTIDDVITPETRAKMEEAKAEAADAKTAADNEAAYNKASGMKKGGITSKFMSFSKTGKPAGMKSVKKMADGGYVRAADGIAARGKTRGKIC